MPATSERPDSDWSIGPARRASLVVAGLTLLGGVAVFANAMSFFLQLPLALLVLIGGSFSIRRLLQPPVRGIAVDGGGVRLRCAAAPSSKGRLVGPPFVSPLYVGFRWRSSDAERPRSLGVFREQMNETDFRRLCAALRQESEA